MTIAPRGKGGGRGRQKEVGDDIMMTDGQEADGEGDGAGKADGSGGMVNRDPEP